MILESCIDYWNGKNLVPLNENIEKKIFEFQQAAVLSDLDIIAFSYRPIQTHAAVNLVKSMAREEPYYNEIFNETVATATTTASTQESTITTPISTDIFDHTSKFRKKNNRSRIVSRFDTALSSRMDEEEFLRNVTKGHTLLGLVSFEYSPKPVYILL